MAFPWRTMLASQPSYSAPNRFARSHNFFISDSDQARSVTACFSATTPGSVAVGRTSKPSSASALESPSASPL